jgi:hypothetical protein
LASEYLKKKHRVEIGREALRQIMMDVGLWRARAPKVEKAHQWRARRSCRGELVQWDTSEHDWLEGRGEKLYLIHMIDDATSESTARFVRHDSTTENMRLLWTYLERHGGRWRSTRTKRAYSGRPRKPPGMPPSYRGTSGNRYRRPR